MREKQLPAEATQISVLLRQARVSPQLPPRFQQNVWRRIKDADTLTKSESWLDALANLVLRPRIAMATATVLLLAGILAGTLEGRQVARQDAQMTYLASVAPHSTH